MKRSALRVLISAIFGALPFIAAESALAALQAREFKNKIGGEPVEIFVISDNGLSPAVEWVALPLDSGYPGPGRPVPELAAAAQTRVATNANFYREDVPDRQVPIGLVISRGQVLSLPHKFYPTAGVIDGKLEWDNVSVETRALLHKKGAKANQSIRICRYNARPTADCASLWLKNIPAGLSNTLYLFGPADAPLGHGLPIGESRYIGVRQRTSHPGALATQPPAWALQLPPGSRIEVLDPEPAVTLEVTLKGQRLAKKWLKATEAVSGSHILTETQTFPKTHRAWAQSRQPRTLIGSDSEGRGWIAVFDGRRETSRGVSIEAAWAFVRKNLAATWALNLDGGGSSTLVYEGILLNRPSDLYPRAIAVGWGARAR